MLAFPLFIPLILYPFYDSSDLDRSNLGNARLQGLPEDVLGSDPTGELFAWVNAAFFFPYVSGSWVHSWQETDAHSQILCQVPATIISKLYPPRVWMAAVACGWGLASSLMVSR